MNKRKLSRQLRAIARAEAEIEQGKMFLAKQRANAPKGSAFQYWVERIDYLIQNVANTKAKVK